MKLDVVVYGVPERCLGGCKIELIPSHVSYRKSDGLVKEATIAQIAITREDEES